MYNGGMKQITETQFFDSLLGDTMTETTYTILNPWSGEPAIEGLTEDKLSGFLSYFAWMFAMSESSLTVKKITVSL